MSRKYKIRNQEARYFISFAVVHWIDVFTRPLYKDIFMDSLKYCQEHKGLEVYAYVLMTNHVHLIIGKTGEQKIEDIIRDLKKFTSYKIVKAISDNPQESRKEWMLWMFERAGKRNSNNKNHQFWRQDNHPIELFSNEVMQQKLDYIHANPVVEGIVDEAESYNYSSAKDYAGKKGLIDVLLLG